MTTEEKGTHIKMVKCFGCGRELSEKERDIGLCKSCAETSVTEGFELLDAEARDKVRAEAMVYV